ncbi:MAG TPA: hypothetical protein DDW52_21455 [Planctomycetaceae bacterium]|nr:hypothetical protein [Planctomycetaceae bacterium]
MPAGSSSLSQREFLLQVGSGTQGAAQWVNDPARWLPRRSTSTSAAEHSVRAFSIGHSVPGIQHRAFSTHFIRHRGQASLIRPDVFCSLERRCTPQNPHNPPPVRSNEAKNLEHQAMIFVAIYSCDAL